MIAVVSEIAAFRLRIRFWEGEAQTEHGPVNRLARGLLHCQKMAIWETSAPTSSAIDERGNDAHEQER